ncbi:MAG: NADH:flavin oxidoreductase/NADH oxidase family protein [Myxococcales bacterium]|nr:NADH:flavin oxidoreductase/NADH oxidase family protein [Myxococcales bacterium]
MAPRLDDSLSLPCGLTLGNRLAKAAMTECVADPRDNQPNARHETLYRRWARGGLGLVVTGNVMVDRRYLERTTNVVIDEHTDRAALRRWAEAAQSDGVPALVQVNHAGRQCSRFVSRRPVAPSEVQVKVFGSFAKPRALEDHEVDAIATRFAEVARDVVDAGFAGVQVHAAHGYLANQFLSPRTNLRDDRWGGSLENRARFGRAVLAAIRNEVGPAFPVAVKLNSADFQRGGFSEDESLQVLHWLQGDGLDLVEISGGSYESRVMLDKPLSDREAFFLDYARKARAAVDIPLMVTGGFRSRAIMEQALAQGALDVVGLARPFTHNPDVARDLCTGRIVRAEDPPPMPGLARLGGTSEAMMSVAQMALLSKGKDPARGMSLRAVLGALVQEGVSLVRGKG